MLTKKQVLEAMPEEKFAQIERVIEELILLEKIEEGLEEMRQGRILTEEEINKEIDKW